MSGLVGGREGLSRLPMVGPPGLEWGCWVTRCFLHVVVIGPFEHF